MLQLCCGTLNASLYFIYDGVVLDSLRILAILLLLELSQVSIIIHCANGPIRRDWEACTKGKMTKKLFSKIGNDQDRDVLELTHSNVCDRDRRQELSDGGLTLPTRGLTYGFQGTRVAKKLRKTVFHLLTRG